jgi:hypothetical protein
MNFMRKHTKCELEHFLSDQFHQKCNHGNASRMSVSFGSKVKRKMIPTHSSIHALLSTDEDIVKDRKSMCDIASKYYTEFFSLINIIMRPHPYTTAPAADFTRIDEKIPMLSSDELRESLIRRNPKRSKYATRF